MKTFKNISAADKKKAKAKIEAFDFSAYSRHLPCSFIKNDRSCVGRDFKFWAQIAPFILDGLISEDEIVVWLHMSEVRNFIYSMFIIVLWT